MSTPGPHRYCIASCSISARVTWPSLFISRTSEYVLISLVVGLNALSNYHYEF